MSVLSSENLNGFTFQPYDYGWKGTFPRGDYKLFGKVVSVDIETRQTPNNPMKLPNISQAQEKLIHEIAVNIPSILEIVEHKLTQFNKEHDREFYRFIDTPHVWLNSEEDNGKSWSFVVGRSDNPDFGYHLEFENQKFIEIWAGD